MGFVADALHEFEGSRAVRQAKGLGLVGEKYFFPLLGQAYDGDLFFDSQFAQHGIGAGELSFAAVHDNQVGQFGSFGDQAAVTAEDDLAHRGEVVCTDDGSYGRKGLVTEALKELIDAGNQYDEVFAIGPMVMMKFVSKTTEPYGIPTTVSMSPIMIDGTGMCGGCRLTVGGGVGVACVDGPDFDGHKVDWDLAVKRNQMYKDFEAHKYEETCNLFKKEAE